ncbi:MAG: zinc-binding dehydrogenase [bacterium]|nr:zinc-binding dehydrogenase [bacterium]
MLRAVINNKQNAVVEEVPLPQPQDNEIVIKIASALTCGSDKISWCSGTRLAIGREFSGTVHAVGANVHKFQVGQAVMTTCCSSCHKCDYCLRGKESYCANFDDHSAIHGIAQFVLLPADVVAYNTFLKPDSLSFTQAAFLEPLSLVMHSLNQLTIHNEDTVVILGSGALGLLQLLAIKATASPQRIILVDTENHSLYLARQLGADHTVNSHEENLQEAIKRYTQNYGAQIIIDNANVPESWDCMLSLASKAATLLTCGGCPSEHLLQLDATRVHYDQMTILGACNYSSQDVAQAQRLLASGALDPQPLVTASLPLTDINKAFQELSLGEAIKFAIIPN